MRAQVAVDTQIMRGINASAVLGVLRAHSRLSVSEVSELTGLSRQAVSRSLSTLAAAQLVEFTPPDAAENRSGRPAQLVRFRAEAGRVLALSVAPRTVRAAIADLRGDLLSDIALPVDAADPIASVRAAITAALDAGGSTAAEVWTASIGSPGIIDPDLGLVRLLPSMSALQGDVLVREVNRMLGCEVHLDNDLYLAAEGELRRGGLDHVSSMVLVEWGERVGAGIVVNGALYRGASNDAGDVGFLPVHGIGEQVAGDGSEGLGPFEGWVGTRELVAAAARLAAQNEDAELHGALAGRDHADAVDLVQTAARAGNPAALGAVDLVARRFAYGLAVIRAVLDPQLVIIGGPMSRFGDLLVAPIRDGLGGEVLNQPSIEMSTLGDDAILYGAVHRALAYVEATYFASHAVTELVTPQARQ